MSYRIGPKQRSILRAIDDDGKELLMSREGHWYLAGLSVNRERCVALHLRGFIMQGIELGSGMRKHELTDKGKAAL